MKVGCVVVLYNPSDENIKNIVEYSDMFDVVIAVDNSSTEEAASMLCGDNIEYVSLHENKGLGYALNHGCKILKERGYTYAVTMDQDSVLKKEGFKGYIEAIKKYDNAALMCPQYNIERKGQVVKQDKVEEVTWTMQSASIFNLDIWEELGCFDDTLFIDTIDYDYCLKAKRHGYAVLKNYSYIIDHEPAITKYTKLFKIGYGYCSPLRIYYQSRNLRELNRRYKYWKIKFILFVKYLKITFLFDNKKEFKAMWKRGKEDFKRNIFGKYYEICNQESI